MRSVSPEYQSPPTMLPTLHSATRMPAALACPRCSACAGMATSMIPYAAAWTNATARTTTMPRVRSGERRRGVASVATRGTARYAARTAGAVASASAPTAVMTAATIAATYAPASAVMMPTTAGPAT